MSKVHSAMATLAMHLAHLPGEYPQACQGLQPLPWWSLDQKLTGRVLTISYHKSSTLPQGCVATMKWHMN